MITFPLLLLSAFNLVCNNDVEFNLVSDSVVDIALSVSVGIMPDIVNDDVAEFTLVSVVGDVLRSVFSDLKREIFDVQNVRASLLE